MAKRSAHSTYARIVGEIAIAWNELEQRLDRLAFHYLPLEADVAGFILGEMGNATKAEFAKFLIERWEEDALLKEHGLHLVALMNRLRENRNILEHALPLSWGGEYHGTIYKVDRRGYEVPFDAPIDALKSLLKTMQDALPYSVWIMRCLRWNEIKEPDGIHGGPSTAQSALRVLASLDRPQLPDKIAPLPPPLELGDERPPPPPLRR